MFFKVGLKGDTRSTITAFLRFLHKNLKTQGLLRQFSVWASWLSLLIFGLLSTLSYVLVCKNVQKDAHILGLQVQKIFYDASEEILEELIRFGKNWRHDQEAQATSSEKKIIFEQDFHAPHLFHWVLRFEPPMLGSQGLWVIPASVAILDETGKKEIGHLIQYVNMRLLTEKIRLKTYRFGMLFAILDPRFGAICQSENSPGDHKSLIFQDVLSSFLSKEKKPKNFSIRWKHQDALFLLSRPLERTPYVIVTGVQVSYFWGLFLSQMRFLTPYFIASLLLLLSVFWWFSYASQIRFRRYQDLFRSHLTRICVETVMDALKTCQIPLFKYPLFRAKELYQESQKICAINLEIQDALVLLDPYLSDSRLKIKLHLSKEMPDLEIDPFIFQKIIVNLLRECAETSKVGEELTLKTFFTPSHVTIIIEDASFFLSKEERLHFAQMYTTSIGNLDFAAVLKLVESISGTLTLTPCHPRGNHFLIEIPRLLSKEQAKNHNVLPLRPRL